MHTPARTHLGHGTRRQVVLGLLASAATVTTLPPRLAVAQTDGDVADDGTPFSFDSLTEDMRAAAQEPFKPAKPVEGFLADFDYDDYQRVRFERERTRWAGEDDARFHLNAFHLGWLFKESVHLHEVSDGMSRPMKFSTRDFDYSNVTADIPADFEMPGVAGFRLMTALNRVDHYDELAAFLGASYFRALGRGNVYGLSARGLAVNTGMSNGEEFPRFTDFWIERPDTQSEAVVLYAALRSQSVTGAYRFVLRPGETTEVDVTMRLFLREDVQQLGIAPLTSMFLFGGADPGEFDDFRPAVHDSDHLVLNTRSGETFLRPLVNPARLGNSYLAAENPVSFGLVQRERDFENYLDAQAHYERRPSLMVEPVGEWGAGHVRLMEIPSDLEGNDNVVAFWVPAGATRAGDTFEFSYRLHWGMSPPGDHSSDHAQILRTRVGKGGVAGVREETDRKKFVIDYKGGLLSELPRDADIEPKVTVMRGDLAQAILSPIEGTDMWRLVIEAVPSGEESSMEIQAAVFGYGRTLSETWLYQWIGE
ncbi:glucan biosynthesis protein [Maritimibacter dapengensis]|uniref:Glucan biosynthesis protein G n=1 Tax=Maritimibacter dapengensis TaxID=2836868 RepID=A0ABS6SY23_9RHOB|nr:glucan biosynthesis protein G [Maritimibacter dapengensis]MBV7377625.1 glucan biosynthesis protein G [Maritimibacter dapengensis]